MVHHANSTSGSLTYTVYTKIEALTGQQSRKAIHDSLFNLRTYTYTHAYIWEWCTRIFTNACAHACAGMHKHMYVHSTCSVMHEALCYLWNVLRFCGRLATHCYMCVRIVICWYKWARPATPTDQSYTGCHNCGRAISSMCEPHPTKPLRISRYSQVTHTCTVHTVVLYIVQLGCY
jgi:hypothetical protein